MINAFLFAASFSICSLPEPMHIDGEVSANTTLNISPKLSEFSMDLSLVATPSNTVEVAFGEDVNFDDKIDHSEIDLIVACECGEWRVIDAATGIEFNGQVSYGVSDFKWRIWAAQYGEKVRLCASLDRHSVFGDIPNCILLFKRSWTHLKITSRGEGQSFGALSVRQSDGWFFVTIR